MPDKLRLIIVSGLSGSGKTVALHVLEDLGYYCIDNLPASLLKAAVNDVRSGANSMNLLAVGVDARTRTQDLESLPDVLRDLGNRDVVSEIIFLHASDDILRQRYGDSRRRHPLAVRGAQLQDAIDKEREILAAIHNSADLIVDTSHKSVYELADVIRQRVDRRETETLSVLIQSFGFKYGIPPDADFVFDLRSLPNPYWTIKLRGLNGLDQEVADYLDAQPTFNRMFEDIRDFLVRWIPHYREAHRGYMTVAIGCTGGQHRSVRMTERLVAALRDQHDPILVKHNSLPGRRRRPD